MSRRTAPLLTRRFLVVWASSLAYFMAVGTTWPVIPVFVEEELTGGPIAVGVSIGAAGLSAAFFRPLLGAVGDHRGRRFILGWGTVAAAVSTLLLVPAGSVPAVVAARLLFGVGEAGAFIGTAAATARATTATRATARIAGAPVRAVTALARASGTTRAAATT